MSQSTVTALQERFAIRGVAEIVAGNGGLPKIQITTALATAEIYLHGAQVTSWKPAGNTEVLFVSEKSRWEDGRAIRGGIPICFPWFRGKADEPKAPSHGVVRTKAWKLDSLKQEKDAVTVTLSTASDEASRLWWPHAFHIEHRISVGTELQLDVTVTNRNFGEGAGPMPFEEALHTYFAVGNIRSVRVVGLDETPWLDNMDGNVEKLQEGDLTFSRATDSAFLDTTRTVDLIDPVLGRRIRTAKRNSLTTVVWNPWFDGASALADLGELEWQQMACVEASNILEYAASVDPGKQHTMSATIAVVPYKE